MLLAESSTTSASRVFDSSAHLNGDVDLVGSYLRDIGRVPLLTHEEEITLGRQVQNLIKIEEIISDLKQKIGEEPDVEMIIKALGISKIDYKRKLKSGQRAKARMVSANLRLVVIAAKKYT